MSVFNSMNTPLCGTTSLPTTQPSGHSQAQTPTPSNCSNKKAVGDGAQRWAWATKSTIPGKITYPEFWRTWCNRSSMNIRKPTLIGRTNNKAGRGPQDRKH